MWLSFHSLLFHHSEQKWNIAYTKSSGEAGSITRSEVSTFWRWYRSVLLQRLFSHSRIAIFSCRLQCLRPDGMEWNLEGELSWLDWFSIPLPSERVATRSDCCVLFLYLHLHLYLSLEIISLKVDLPVTSAPQRFESRVSWKIEWIVNVCALNQLLLFLLTSFSFACQTRNPYENQIQSQVKPNLFSQTDKRELNEIWTLRALVRAREESSKKCKKCGDERHEFLETEEAKCTWLMISSTRQRDKWSPRKVNDENQRSSIQSMHLNSLSKRDLAPQLHIRAISHYFQVEFDPWTTWSS